MVQFAKQAPTTEVGGTPEGPGQKYNHNAHMVIIVAIIYSIIMITRRTWAFKEVAAIDCGREVVHG